MSEPKGSDGLVWLIAAAVALVVLAPDDETGSDPLRAAAHWVGQAALDIAEAQATAQGLGL